MKSIAQLKQLAQNPFYKLSPEEQAAINAHDSAQQAQAPQEGNPNPKVVFASKGNAAVKETGKLNKHGTDPVTE